MGARSSGRAADDYMLSLPEILTRRADVAWLHDRFTLSIASCFQWDK